MTRSKGNLAAQMGLNIVPGADMPKTDKDSIRSKTCALARNAQPDGIGKSIQKRAAYGRVNAESIRGYLDNLRTCGVIVKSALAVNLSYSSIAHLRKVDPEFAAEEEQAKQLWIAEKLDAPLREIGIEGIMKPIFSPKTGLLLGHERVIHSQVTLAYARKFDPAYSDKQEVDVNHSGGVLVVTAPAPNAINWKERFGSGNHHKDVIDAETVPAKLIEKEGGGTISP